ncbi:MAG: hypothetical protein Q9M22_06145 [Mariprofundaceae bacterium]|nr:hypothetical protein [Mariprofundaceae bacterium]
MVKALWVSLFLLLVMPAAHAGETGAALLQQRCVACHDLQGPAPTTLTQLFARKAPDLFYAGNKYQTAWVAAWLQQPKRIRPAGMLYLDHIKPGVKRDMVDSSTLKPHMALNNDDANKVAHALALLKPYNDRIKAVSHDPSISPGPLGEMLFDKIYGCMACHQIEPDFGGLSAPEIFTAGKRLQAAYMLSYIRSPQAWDAKTWMPNKHVSSPNDQKLVNYIIELSKENFDE